MKVIYIGFCCLCFLIILNHASIKNNCKNSLLTKRDTNAIKGVAAIGVMLAHYAIWMEMYFKVEEGIIFMVFKQLGGLGVLLFFFVSGYGIYLSSLKNTVNQIYLLKRIGNVYLPYVFIKFVLEVIKSFANNTGEIDLWNSLKEISGLNFTDWYITVILLQYVLYWVAWNLSEKYRICFTIVFTCMLIAIYIYLDLDTAWYNGVLLFPFGMIIAKYQKAVIKMFEKKFGVKLILLIVSFTVLGLMYIMLKGYWYTEFIKTTAGIILAMSCVMLLYKIQLNSKILAWIGKKSLYVYIIHMHIWSIMMTKFSFKPIIVLLFSIILTFVLSWICETFYRVCCKSVLVIIDERL